MANYAVATYATPLGTHAEVEAELERVVESLPTGKTLHLLGINDTSRDRDQCIGFLICDEVLWTQSAYHDLVDSGPIALTEV
ncbi:unnamed protein product [marine sediment metagenome]|uniref:Uncharacterized protein n=1 Tax=marine sediment metagenome TaxID=412755 RepID=X0SAP3_9ZZZZ